MFQSQLFLCVFQSKTIEDNIEDMLVRLDEFSHLADTVRKNVNRKLKYVLLKVQQCNLFSSQDA